ncbi:MAG: UTP--glucose-1-phosphate uridylyltransferase [Spirochaetes bacterium]|nr:UTP--glucose-1-phosphate uridylyltransferase [Spirochaetota bacterium]
MNFEQCTELLNKFSQNHIAEHLRTLSGKEQSELIGEISSVNFDKIEDLLKIAGSEDKTDKKIFPADCISINNLSGKKDYMKICTDLGVDIIKKGKVAAFVVAGGQGSRLGFEGPKGAFPVSAVKNKTLFQLHAEKVLSASRKYGVKIPFLIMTSHANHAATVDEFKKNSYFGLDSQNVHIFPQNMIPSLDTAGKLILSGRTSLFKNPDGHGGSLSALESSGVLDIIMSKGVEYISYFQVDNPLINIIDPLFFGVHGMEESELSSKALIKAYPDEKVGIFVKYENSSIGVEEYSDLSKDILFAEDSSGSLLYKWGSIGIHIFSCSFIKNNISGGEINLPFHVARKKIKAYINGEIKEIEGFKFEKFVFDSIPLAKKSIILETLRENEFAPVKNASGIDSLESSRELMNGLFRSWLAAKNYSIPDFVKNIEISPLVALCGDDFPSGLSIDWKENTYIGI